VQKAAVTAGPKPRQSTQLRKGGIALTSHSAHFRGDKMLWLREHMVAIDWSGYENLKHAVAVYAPEPKRR